MILLFYKAVNKLGGKCNALESCLKTFYKDRFSFCLPFLRDRLQMFGPLSMVCCLNEAVHTRHLLAHQGIDLILLGVFYIYIYM